MDKDLKSILESLLFASGNPVGVAQLAEITGEEPKTVRMTLLEMAQAYAEQGRGIEIVRYDDKFQMMSAKLNTDYVKILLDNRRNPTLSQAAMEVLAVAAYNQPVTRAYIEQVRGVDCSAVIHNLTEKELIEEKGRLDAPGRPLLYGTTVNFLRVFNITSLTDLPEMDGAVSDGLDPPEQEQLTLLDMQTGTQDAAARAVSDDAGAHAGAAAGLAVPDAGIAADAGSRPAAAVQADGCPAGGDAGGRGRELSGQDGPRAGETVALEDMPELIAN